ncbi:hypothetical protein [Pontibacter sp. SGAir0037]|uniref:hypothetical protein n=1 Tax=Pontibacter sp. SGAir0037 TaxID=2571030 RepID=UPI0010CCFCB9|nr:hypothetical protein [Pontibacter sp. SGAir0037]QCR21648.1 hypothetical protein C1N53_04350 [Pontibacter sp. SGAir0037]
MKDFDINSEDWWNGDQKPDQAFFNEANTKIKAIYDSLNSFQDEEVQEDKTKKVDKIKLLEGLIKHYLDLTKVLDQRRGDYFKAGLQLFTIALAGLGIVIRYISPSNLTIVGLISASIAIGLVIIIYTGFRIITTYYWQTKSDRYHFLKIDAKKLNYLGNSWMWFYHGVPGVSKIPFTDNEKKKSAKDLESNKKGVLGYLEGAEAYFNNYIKASDKDIFIQHLRYTYLLLVHNAYKNKFDRQLTDRLSIGTRNAAFATVTALLISFGYSLVEKLPFNRHEIVDMTNRELHDSLKQDSKLATFHQLQQNATNKDNTAAIESITASDSIVKGLLKDTTATKPTTAKQATSQLKKASTK